MNRRTFFMTLAGGVALSAGLASTEAEARALIPSTDDIALPASATTGTEDAAESPQEMQYYYRRPRRVVYRPRRVIVRRPRRVVVYRRRPVYVAPRRRYW